MYHEAQSHIGIIYFKQLASGRPCMSFVINVFCHIIVYLHKFLFITGYFCESRLLLFLKTE